MSTLKSVASTGNKCIKSLNSVEVGTTLSNFNVPRLLDLMYLNHRGAEYHCYCDGELVSNVATVPARGIVMFINNCKSLNLTLQNKIHRITYILPYGDKNELKYGMYIRYIIPTVNGEPIVSNNLRSELGVYQNGYYLMNLSDVEKDFISRMDGIVVQWGKEQGVMIDEYKPEPEVERFKITEITNVQVIAGLGSSSTNRTMQFTFTFNPAWTGSSCDLTSDANFSISSSGSFELLKVNPENKLLLTYTGNPTGDVVVTFSGNSEIEPFTLSFHVNLRTVTNIILE